MCVRVVANRVARTQWRVFGFNFMFLSAIKYLTLMAAMMNFCVLFAIYGTVAICLLAYYKPKFDEEKARACQHR